MIRKILLTFQITLLVIKRRKKLLLLLLVMLFLLFGGTWLIKDRLLKPTISEGLIGTYTEEDLPQTVTNFLSQGMVVLDESGMSHGSLASSWETNNDATLYDFKLKDNLHWVDGSQLSAQDLKFALPDVEVKTDGKSIQFKLSDSFSPFPALLTKPVFKKGTYLGTGPYRIKSMQKDQIFIKKLTLNSTDKNLPDVTIRFYPNERIAKTALKLGEVQVVLGLSETSGVDQEKTLNIKYPTNFGQIVTIFYNTKDPVLSDENLRLGLSYAAPSIRGEDEAKTSIPPRSWAFNKDVKDYLDNPEQAKASLGKAHLNGVIILTATSSLAGVGESVVESWRKLGVNTVLRVESGIPQNFQALLIAQNIPQDPDQYSLWHSTQSQTNISKISLPRVDKDLEDGRKSTDMEVRKQKYQDFQKVLLDHAPATFLYFPKYNVVYRKKVEKDLNKILKLQLPQIFM